MRGSSLLVLFGILTISVTGISNAYALSEITNYYDVDTSCTTWNGDTSFYNLTDATDFDFKNGKDYFILWSMDMGGQAFQSYGVYVERDGVVIDDSYLMMESVTSGNCGSSAPIIWNYQWFDVFTSDGSDSFEMMLNQSSTSNGYARNLHVFVMDLSEIPDQWEYDTGGSDTLDPDWNTADDSIIVIDTGGVTEDWFIIGSNHLETSSAAYSANSRIYSNATATTPDVSVEGEDTTYDAFVHTLPFATTYNGIMSFEMEAFSENTATHSRQSSKIFGVNLGAFNQSSYSYTNGGIALGDVEYGYEVSAINEQPNVTGNWFLLGYHTMQGTPVGQATEYRLQYDNLGTMTDVTAGTTSRSLDYHYPWDQNDKFPQSDFGVKSLDSAAPRRTNVDASEVASTTSLAYERLVVGFSLQGDFVTNPPDTQTNGNATTVSPTGIDLLWTDSSNSTETPDGFYIERESPVGGGWSNIATTTNVTTSYQDRIDGAGLLNTNTIYNYRVLGYNSFGNSSSWSSAFSNTTQALFNESDPVNFVSGSTTIDLDWLAPTGNGVISGYKIERAPIDGGWTTLTANTTNNNLYYNDTGLTADTSYNYRFSVHNEGGTGTTSSNFTGSTWGSPTAPASLIVDGGDLTDVNIGGHLNDYIMFLNWTAGSPNGYPVIGYKIERAIGGGGFATLQNNTGTTDITYVDTNTLPAEKYTYRISTWNTFGESKTTSPEMWNVTHLDPVDDLFVQPHMRTSPSQLNLTWNYPDRVATPSAITGWQIEREVPVGGGWSVLVANDTGTCGGWGIWNCSYENTGLSTNNYYNYRVSPHLLQPPTGDPDITLAPSNTYSTTTYHLPDAVETLTATSNGDFITVDLSWTVPTTLYGYLQGYMINFTTPEGDPTSIYTNNTGSSATTATVTGLSAGDDYSFRVSAITLHGTNVTGGFIANASAFSDFEIGTLDLSVPTSNPTFPVLFTLHSINDTTSDLQVTYDSSYDLACDFEYKFARTNQTYTGLTETTISGTSVYTNFTLSNPDNEIIDVYCWDQLDNSTDGRHRLTQSTLAMPLLEQYTDFQSGVFGTSGMFGALDLMTLFVVIISMIGFNRYNPAVGVIFMVILIGGMSYFGFISVPTVILGVIALVTMLAIVTVRKS